MSRAWARAAPGAFVALVALLVYAPSLAFGWTGLDDRDLIVEDRAFLADAGGLWHAFTRSYLHVVDAGHAYYRPIVTASFVVDAAWSGTRPFGYHLTNAVLHAFASALLFALLRRLGFGALAAAGGALFFTANPALVPAVAWVPGRNDVLLAIFALAGWVLLLRDAERPSWPVRAAHLGCFALALLTKETAMVLPLVFATQLVLLDRSVLPRRGPESILWLWVGWAALVAARLGIQRALHLGGIGDVAARDAIRAASLVLAQVGQVTLPVDPSLIGVADDAPVTRGALVCIAFAAATRWLPGVRVRIVAIGAASAVLLALPAAAVAGTVVLGHRLYLPACGVAIGVAEIARALSRERAATIAFSSVAIVALAVLAIGYEDTFRDRRRFSRAAVDAAPHSALAHFCLGQSAQMDGEDDRALAEYALALRLGPVDIVHNNIAVIHMAHARWSDAERELKEEIAENPGYARAYENLRVVENHMNAR